MNQNELDTHGESGGHISARGINLASEISVHETKRLKDSGAEFVLIDCREEHEHDKCQIDGSILMPFAEISERQEEFEAFRGKRIVVHCHHGGRSLQVVNWLRNHGFDLAQNMTGGIEAWSRQIDQEVPRY
jgi:rhodanese-related sulfurtransferase